MGGALLGPLEAEFLFLAMHLRCLQDMLSFDLAGRSVRGVTQETLTADADSSSVQLALPG